MDSKYIHLIALILAVFFAGIFLRGESGRKKEIKRAVESIQKRQAEINAIVDEIDRVTAEKDSLLKLQIAQAKQEIQTLTREEQLAEDRIDAIGGQIDAAQRKIAALIQQINDVPDFTFDEPGFHSIAVDPDIAPEDSVDFNTIRTFMAPALVEDAPAALPTPRHLGIARMFADRKVREVPRNSNRGPDVEKFLASVNLKPWKDRFGEWHSYPYCAAFISYCLTEAGGVSLPGVRSALAQDFITRKSIRMELVLRGSVRIDPGTIVVWKRNVRDPKDKNGHAGIVIDWEGQAGTTVEGNTPAGSTGSQAEGDGVYIRQRILQPGNAFRITHFTPVGYE